jgi:multidrug efflux pump subunit AcrA (membrane-fusion protein)
MNKKIILIIIIIILVTFGVYQVFLKEKKPEFNLIEVVRGDIVQEIFESGQVGRGEKINLIFENAGKIEKIYAGVGDEVKAGQELAKLDTSNLYIQLQEVQTGLELAQLNLNKLLAGAGPEEIKITETQLENAEITLGIAKENLKNSYETAITVSDGSYPQIYNALDFVKEFVGEYINIYDEDGRTIMRARDEIERAEAEAKLYLGIAKESSRTEASVNGDVETALLIMKNSLETAFDSLETIREIADKSAIYRERVSAADKASLDTLKTNINGDLTNVIGVQQTISSMKSNVETVQTKLQEAESRLDLIKAEVRQVDIDLSEAQIRQAQTRVQFYENQIQQSKLISPAAGKIIEIKKRIGELVQPTSQDVVIVVLPIAPYEIKVDIYEEDVIEISVGNSVEITLVAFPDKKIEGRVISISPAEKIVDGVVYYETTIGFEEMLKEIKPGMTADVIIQADLKENVMIISRDAIQEKDDKTIVEVFKNGQIQERDIEIGLRGSNDMVEVLSGLEEGEKVIQR